MQSGEENMNKKALRLQSIIALGGFISAAAIAATPNPQAQAFRANYGIVLEGLEQSLVQNGNTRGLALLRQSRASLNTVSDESLAHIFRQGIPDISAAAMELQSMATRAKARPKSAGLPSASPIISACDSNPHDSQTVYDTLIAAQVTSGILAAATFVCTEDILGENGAAACIPFAIADDIAQSLFAVRQFCQGEEGGAKSDAAYDRLDHIHTDLANAQSSILSDNSSKLTSILNNSNTNKDTIVDAVNAAKSAVITSGNTNTTTVVNTVNTAKTEVITVANSNTSTIVNNSNANALSIINNANANRDVLIGELHALACELIRLSTTPDGQRASSIQACQAQPGFPYSWNRK
jgi:hypothetical protein